MHQPGTAGRVRGGARRCSKCESSPAQRHKRAARTKLCAQELRATSTRRPAAASLMLQQLMQLLQRASAVLLLCGGGSGGGVIGSAACRAARTAPIPPSAARGRCELLLLRARMQMQLSRRSRQPARGGCCWWHGASAISSRAVLLHSTLLRLHAAGCCCMHHERRACALAPRTDRHGAVEQAAVLAPCVHGMKAHRCRRRRAVVSLAADGDAEVLAAACACPRRVSAAEVRRARGTAHPRAARRMHRFAGAGVMPRAERGVPRPGIQHDGVLAGCWRLPVCHRTRCTCTLHRQSGRSCAIHTPRPDRCSCVLRGERPAGCSTAWVGPGRWCGWCTRRRARQQRGQGTRLPPPEARLVARGARSIRRVRRVLLHLAAEAHRVAAQWAALRPACSVPALRHVAHAEPLRLLGRCCTCAAARICCAAAGAGAAIWGLTGT